MPGHSAKMHNPFMVNWSDLRHFLAVAREGSTLAAAKSLGVNQSTVHRRLAALESALGQPLALRSPSGYRLTEFGKGLLPYATSVEDAVLATEIAARGLRAVPSGTIRLSCPEPIVGRLTASGLISGFEATYPSIRVEFVIADRYLDLWRGEADVSLRSGDPEDLRLVGRKVAESHWALYGSRSYVTAHGRPTAIDELEQHSIVAFEGAMSGHRANSWLAEAAPRARIVARSASVLGVLTTVKSGVGIAPLPTTIADAEPELLQLLPPIPALQRGWYLLTRPDLRGEPPVANFFDYLIGDLPTLQRVLMG